MNLNNVSLIKHNGSIIDLIKWNGSILYRRLLPYAPYEFENKTSITEVETLVNESHTNLYNMFFNCFNLVSVNAHDWDTSNVTTMRYMFYGCESLTSLDVSNWETSNVTNMEGVFCGCRKLTSLDLSNWDTSEVTRVDYMFQNCLDLASINGISNLDTNKVTHMEYMFNNCSRLTELDLSNWDVSDVTYFSNMFGDCTQLTSLNLANWSFSYSSVNMSMMFQRCKSLVTLDLRNWKDLKTSTTYMANMFNQCDKLKELRLDNSDLDTILRIITSSKFPTGTVDGEKRKIYVNQKHMGELSAVPESIPDGWEFVYVD